MTSAASYGRHKLRGTSSRRNPSNEPLWPRSGGPSHLDRSPGHALYVFLAGDELSGNAIQHVEEAVFRRMQQDLAIFAVNVQVRQDNVLGSREIPGLARCLLKIPDHLAGVRLDGDDRA